MKRLLYILPLLILSFFAKGQSTYPITQNLGSSTTLVKVPTNGGLQAVLVATPFVDTTAANAVAYVKYTAGAMIRTTGDGKFWKRNEAKTAWIDASSGTVDFDFFEFLNDSTLVICFASGSCDTVDFNNNNVFVTVNNQFGGCNNLLSGGVVTANDPTATLVFDVTAADYTIGCKAYNTSAAQVTLANGHATLGRFDVIAVDTNETVIVIQGTPSSDPQVPQVDFASQLALTTILVPAGATTATQLGITQTVIYDQNLGIAGGEWDGAATSWTIDRDNLSFPFHLTKSALLSGSTISTSEFSWVDTDTMRNGQYDVFKFYIRLTDAWVAGQGLDIAFYNGTTKVSNSVIFQNNSYGFDQTVTGSYQQIAIPMANWVLTDSIFFKVVFKPLATPFSSQAYRLDWIQLQGGINQAIGGSSGLYIWNQYSLSQPANYWIKGDAKVEGQFTSPQRISVNGTTFYSGSEKIGLNAIASGTEATVFGAYARGTATGAVAIGSQAQSTGGIAIGQYANSGGQTNVAIGGVTSATGGTLIGRDATITANDAVVIGETSHVTAIRSIGIGYQANVTHSNSIAIGYSISSTANNQFIIPSTITNVKWGGFGDGAITGTATYLAAWDVDGNFVEYPPGGISGGLLIDADNGLSVRSATTAVLGQNVGEVGNPAILLSNREIPMGNFTLNFNADAAQSNNMTVWKNSSANIRARITSAAAFSNTGGFANSEAFGDGATVGGATSLAVGNSANSGDGANIAMGYAATIQVGYTGVTLIGTSSTQSGAGNATLVGSSITSTGRSTGIGIGGTYSSSNNVGVGENVVIGHTYSIGLGFGATTTAANQLVLGADINSGTEGGLNDIYWGEGVLSVSPNNVSLNANSGSGTNIAGGTLTINASRATGNAAGGSIILSTSDAGASGTTLQTLSNKFVLSASGALRLNNYGDGTFTGTDTKWLAVDVDGNIIEENPPTGTAYTASQGISLNTADFRLGETSSTGGEFLVDRFINTSTNRLTISGSKDRLFWVESASGRTAYFQGNDGNYVANVVNVSTGGGLLVSTGAGGVASNLSVLDASTNTVLPVVQVDRQTDGTAAAGMGASIQFLLESTTTTGQISNELKSTWTTATHASRVSEFSITGVNSATTRTLMTLGGAGLMTLGVSGTNTGSLAFAGVTSGLVTIQPASAAGTYTLTLPTDDGTPSQVLTTNGSGVLSWTTPAGTGDVIKVGTPVNNQLGVWTGDGTIEGDANLTFASSTLNIGVAGASTGILTVSGSTSGTVTIQPAAAAGTYTLTLPTNDGDASQFLQTDGSGNLTWATGGGSSTWNGITDPTGDQALTFDVGEISTWTNANTTEDLLTINSSTVTTSSFLSLNRTGTANAAGNNIAEFVSTGVTATSSITNTGVLISVTNTGTTSTNNALTLTASGATTNNAINVTAGRVLLPAGSSTVHSLIIGATGLYEYAAGGGGLMMYEAGTTRLILSGQYGIQFRDASTFAFDVGNAGTLGNTNRFRITAPAVGTMQLGMEVTQQSMIFKGANNAGTDAAGFNMTYQPGAGTGNSTSAGTLIFSTPDAGASGTTVQSYTTKFTVGRFGGVWASRNSQVQGADVASVAGAIAVGNDGNAFELTGTNAVTLISNVNWQNGSIITFLFTSTATLTDGTANSGTDIGMELAGNTNFVGSAGATLTLVLSEIGGTQRWREVARSVN